LNRWKAHREEFQEHYRLTVKDKEIAELKAVVRERTASSPPCMAKLDKLKR